MSTGRDQRPQVELRVGDHGIPRWYRTLILTAAVLTIPAATVEFFVDSGPWHDVAHAVNVATWAIFVLGAVSRAQRSGNARRWLLDHPGDVAVAALSIPAFPYPMQLLRGLWLLGEVRASGLQRRIFSGASIRFAIVLVVVTIVAGGSLFAELEHDDVGTGLYWAMTTVTTVGYGDVVPTTGEGRGLAMVVMAVGILSLGFLTAAASERFMRSLRAPQDEQQDAVLARLDEIVARLDRIEGGPPRPVPPPDA